jgi:hypothetical protein
LRASAGRLGAYRAKTHPLEADNWLQSSRLREGSANHSPGDIAYFQVRGNLHATLRLISIFLMSVFLAKAQERGNAADLSGFGVPGNSRAG